MPKDPAFLFYPGDYLRDTQTLSEKSQVAYDRIMCEHMRNICISKQQLKFFTKRLSPEELEEMMFVLTEKEDGFQIEWVAESIQKRKEYSESRRNNRVKKHTEDMNNISKSYDKHMENENEIENIIEYLNKKTKSKFSSKTKNTIKHINARFSDGFKINDFIKVIDFKFEKWGKDENMKEYLRPDTLFGTKFESYLNASNNKKIDNFKHNANETDYTYVGF